MGLINQGRRLPLKKKEKLFFIIKEYADLKRFGFSLLTLPIVLFSIITSESKYRFIQKVLSKFRAIAYK